MVRDFRDILCSTLKRKENCMSCTPEKLTARTGILKEAYNRAFPKGFLDDLYTRYRKREIVVVRYGNIFPLECARQFFIKWVPEYFNLQSDIHPQRILEIVDKYSLENQKIRVMQVKQDRSKRGRVSWKESITIPGLSGNLHLNHFSNNGMKDSWKTCFTIKDKLWITRKLHKHLVHFNYSVALQ
jgi:hypothetical protein